MNKPPAFQFYAGDFLNGTASFTAEETGAYIRLLCHQWDKGTLPLDPKRLCILAGCTEDALASIMHKFASDGNGGLQNHRLEKTRQKQKAFKQSRSQNALGGWEGEKGEARRHALASKVHKLRRSKKHGLHSSSSYNTTPTPSSDNPFADDDASDLSTGAAEIVTEWNATSFPKCVALTDKRASHLKVRLESEYWRSNWRAALERAKISNFLLGRNDRKWKANIDWFIRSDDAVVSILEGKYDNKHLNGSGI